MKIALLIALSFLTVVKLSDQASLDFNRDECGCSDAYVWEVAPGVEGSEAYVFEHCPDEAWGKTRGSVGEWRAMPNTRVRPVFGEFA